MRARNSGRSSATRAEATSRHSKQYYEMDGNRGMYVDGWEIVARYDGMGRYSFDDWELYDLKTDPTQTVDLSGVEVERTAAMASEWEDTAWRKQVFPLTDDSDLEDPVSPKQRLASRPVEILRGAQTLDRYRSRILVQMRSFDVRIDFGDGYQPADEGVLIAHGDQAGGYLLYIEDGNLHFCYNYGGRTRDFKMGTLGPQLDRIDVAFIAQPEGVCSVQIEVRGERREVPAQFNIFAGETPFQGIDVGIDRRSPVSRALRSRRGTFAYKGALRSVKIVPGQRLSEMRESFQTDIDREHNNMVARLDD